MDDVRFGSWKEIADYLGVTVRTAQRWERERGLPVKRLPGGRGPVGALKSELRAWADGPGSAEPETPEAAGERWRPSWRWICAAAGLFVAAAGIAAFRVYREPRNFPKLARVEGETLLVSDQDGKLLWSRTLPNLNHTAYALHPAEDWIWHGDLDQDGRTETLFAKEYVTGGRHFGQLVCFDDYGAEKWSFTPGRPLSSAGGEHFSGDYHPVAFRVAAAGERQSRSIVLLSYQDSNYPVQVALLSPSGELMREYFHSGYIGYENMKLADADGDGREEILLAGVSNGYGCATLVVLDPETMEGASVEENRYFQLLGCKPGREKRRVLFRQSCMNRVLHPVYNDAQDVRVAPGRIRVGVKEAWGVSGTMFYAFGPDYRLLEVSPGDDFRNTHAQMYARHTLDHELTEPEIRSLRDIRDLTQRR